MYLSLDRPTSTLSGGEGQRIRTVLHLDSALTDLTYVFDEPAAGLHAHDVAQIVTLLTQLRDKGNTVIVVEHHRDVITAADHVIDLGPGAGTDGGTLTYAGDLDGLRASGTLTAQYLARRDPATARERTPTGQLRVEHATTHNLADLTLDVPLGVLTCLTGVAGAGKSFLIASLPRRSDITVLDQRPIRGSRRSNPGTYTGILDHLRELYAKTNNVKPALFSANGAGACAECHGLGVTYLDTSFRESITLLCGTCQGRRYRPELLAYAVNGLSIDQALALPITQATQTFEQTAAHPMLARLDDIGLGYLTLGQPMTTLSGGERQRLRLAIEMQRHAQTYVLDEPTTGLHPADTANLIRVLHELVDTGASVIVADHDLDLIASADHVIDLGPGAGHAGGQLVFQGTPRALCEHPGPTRTALHAHLTRKDI